MYYKIFLKTPQQENPANVRQKMGAVTYLQAKAICEDNDAELAAITNENEWNFITSEQFWSTYPDDDLFFWNNGGSQTVFWMGAKEIGNTDNLADAKFYWKDSRNEYLQKGTSALVDIGYQPWKMWIKPSPSICNSGRCDTLQAGLVTVNKEDVDEWHARDWRGPGTVYHSDGSGDIVSKNMTGIHMEFGWTDQWNIYPAWALCQIRI